MATHSHDGDGSITDSRAYHALQFMKLLLTVATLLVAVWKGLNGTFP